MHVIGVVPRHILKAIFVCSQTAIYATGVGLGASKGKEVGKYQEGYAGYVNMVKDSVSHPPLRSCPFRPLTLCDLGTRAVRELSFRSL